MTDFQDDAQLDTGQVEDRRGRRAAGRPMAVGGGALGIVVVIITLLLGGNPLGSDGGGLGGLNDLNAGQVGEGAPPSDIQTECQTGADAERREDCRAIAYVNSINTFWERTFAQFTPATTVFFTDSVDTGCGQATSDVGPFYCPPDQKVYIDLGFLAELRDRFGASGGAFAQGYILAHEYGHHVQNLRGVLDQVKGDRTGPQSAAVRSELQADCYAGAWIGDAEQQTDENGVRYFDPITDQQIADALSAASAVGDDHIQETTSGQVQPETWTHGSSEQRQRWFTTGRTGGPESCDTFSVSGSQL